MTMLEVAADTDLAECLRLHNTVLPTDPLFGPEVDRLLSAPSESFYGQWFAVEVDGAIAGCAWSGHVGSTAHVGVVVDPSFRGRGLGAQLADAVLDRVPAHVETSAFRVEPGDPAAARLCSRHGFERWPNTGGDRWVSEPLAARDWSAVEPLELVTDELLDDPVQLEQLRAVADIAGDDVPGADPVTIDELVVDQLSRRQDGGFALIARDTDGTIVGEVTGRGAPWTDVLSSEHVLVGAGHRGRGLGRRLKEAQHCEAAQRGFTKVVTDVRPDNAPMLAILQRLGYHQEHRPSYVRRPR